ncbi:MAG: molybdopterin-guanine dinucleotide biosynthesis protein A [Minwuia sp.]|uniref:molybdopterin-guanine dinucleotide biosynthesis protein A n=1 Tax=Minwuia sp. TaxID=2493630 RepID=UPI003A869103
MKRFLAVLIISLAAGGAAANDRHEGYYYPGPVTEEVYGSRATVMPEAERALRYRFITGYTQEQMARPYPPPHAMYAKGADGEKLLLIGTGADSFRNLYQARAVLAQMTAIARGTPLFRDMQVEEVFTFLDLAKMMGFSQITVSDGVTFAHRIVID